MTILIIGCTPEDTNQTADLPPAKNTAESAVDPVEEPVEESEAKESADSNAPESDLGEVVNSDVTLVAPSGGVDLSELTPAAGADQNQDLIVQPAPGIPDPELKMVQLAAENLANRLGIDIGEITLVEATFMDWPDSGLGCPSPDLLYAAVITPGYQITLEAQGQTYIYHTDSVDNVVLCVDGLPAE